MPSFLESLGESINRASCVVLGDFAARLEVLQYVLEPLATSPNYNGAAATYAERCGLPLPTGFTPQPQFAGGQCPTAYTVNTQFIRTVNGAQQPPNNDSLPNIPGTIKGIERFQNGNDIGVNLLHGASGNPSAIVRTRVVLITNAVPNNINIISPRITSVVRTDNQPDNCGSLPPVIPPYTPGSNVRNENVNITNNDNSQVNIPVVLAFGYASFNLDGTINIPVNANFTLNPEFNGNFNFNFNNGEVTPDVTNPNQPLPPGCSDPGGYVPDPAIPAPPSGIPDDPPLPTPTDDPTEREKLLAACIVTVSSVDPNTTTIIQDENPDIYAPSAGTIMFQIKVGNSSGWTNDIPVKNARCFIPCPWEGGAIKVRGTPRYGSIFTITPVYFSRSANPTFPA